MDRSDGHHRTAIGLTIAAGLAAALGWLLLFWAAEASLQSALERAGRQRASALADLVERAGPAGNRVRAAASALDEADPRIERIRVVSLERRELVASTSAQDAGGRSAPRQLEMAEKPLFDLAQELRAAVATNRDEGSARKDEIRVLRLPSGGVTMAAPLQRGEDVIGMVQLEVAPAGHVAAPGVLPALAAWLAPVLLFLLLAIPLRGRRYALLGVAAALLVIAVGVQTAWAASVLSDEARRAADEAGQDLSDLGSVAGRTLASLPAPEPEPSALPPEPALEGAPVLPEQSPAETGPLEDTPAAGGFPDLPSFDLSLGAAEEAAVEESPIDPAAWDVDRFRRPLRLLAPDGTTTAGALSAAHRRATQYSIRGGIGIGLLCLVLLGFVGSGAAGATAGALARYRTAYLYILPAMLGMTLLVFFPFLYGIVLSFTDSNLYNTSQPLTDTWIGLDNYREVLGDFQVVRRTDDGWSFNFQSFYWTLFFTIVWTITNVAIGVSLGLVLALMLNTKGLAGRPIYRVLLILPWAVPTYITALTWRGMFHRQFGVINQVLQIFGIPALSWYDKPFTSFLTALTTNGWLSFPFMMVVSLGALQSIPAELYEAARVDGASRWQQFKAITLPSLKPALVPAIILSVVWTFNQFNVIYLVTAGEPGGSTEILITEAYKIAFEKYRYGYAAAYSTVIFAILLAYGVVQNRATRATEDIA